MDFNKPSTSKKIERFLLDNLKMEKEKESLINVLTDKPVLKGDAIALLLSIVQAMTISDEVNMEDFESARLGDDGEEKNPPTAGHSGTQADKINSFIKVLT